MWGGAATMRPGRNRQSGLTGPIATSMPTVAVRELRRLVRAFLLRTTSVAGGMSGPFTANSGIGLLVSHRMARLGLVAGTSGDWAARRADRAPKCTFSAHQKRFRAAASAALASRRSGPGVRPLRASIHKNASPIQIPRSQFKRCAPTPGFLGVALLIGLPPARSAIQ